MDGDLIDRIYEAAVIPEFWRSTLAGLAASAEKKEAILISARGADVRWIASSPAYEEIATEYFRTYTGVDNERTRRLLAARHPGFVSDNDVFTIDEIAREPVFRDFFTPRGLGSGIATVILPPGGDQIVVHCEGAATDGAPQRAQIQALDRLRPHLARAILLAAQLGFVKARAAAAVLELMGLPAAVVTADGRTLAANASFAGLTAQILIGARDQVTLKDAGAARLLEEALARPSDDPGFGRSIPLAAAADAPPTVFHLLPVRRAARDVFSRAAWLLVATPVGAGGSPSAELLGGLFDLTPAEARVARDVVEGRTIAEIAAAGVLSVATVRNQLHAVFAKTGVSRQSELVLLCGGLMGCST